MKLKIPNIQPNEEFISCLDDVSIILLQVLNDILSKVTQKYGIDINTPDNFIDIDYLCENVVGLLDLFFDNSTEDRLLIIQHQVALWSHIASFYEIDSKLSSFSIRNGFILVRRKEDEGESLEETFARLKEVADLHLN